MKFFSLLMLVTSLLYAQNTFEKHFGGDREEIGKAILTLNDGYLVGGTTESFARGQTDAYIIKIDKNGDKVWSKVLGGSNADTLESLLAIKGGFIFCGSTKSFGEAMLNTFVGRISQNGQTQWVQALYLDKDDSYRGYDMAKINDEHIMIAGSHKQRKMFNSNLDSRHDAVNIDGKHTFGISFGFKNEEELKSIIRVSNGYVTAGYTESYGKGGKDIYINRIDNDAHRVWHVTYGFNDDETANQIIATNDGGFIVVGTTYSARAFSRQVYVVKIDAKGRKIWDGHYGYKLDEEGRGIIEVEDGYVIAGYTRSTKNRAADVYVLKLNHSGKKVWQYAYGGYNDDEAYAIANTADGGMIVTGFSTDAKKSKELYILKLDKNGKL